MTMLESHEALTKKALYGTKMLRTVKIKKKPWAPERKKLWVPKMKKETWLKKG